VHRSQRAVVVFLLCAVPVLSLPQTTREQKHKVEVRFIQSSYADYLFYLLYRSTGQFSALEADVPIGKIPTLDSLISLPEQAASAHIGNYRQLYPLVRRYKGITAAIVPVSQAGRQHFRILVYSDELPSYGQLDDIVHRGEAVYPAFQNFWAREIAPAERQTIDVWKQQLSECAPLEKLQELERLSFPFSTLDVGAIALHLGGSGNTYPPGVYTSTSPSLFKKPNLASAIGHEATHLMVNQYAGHMWRSYPQADRAIELVTQHGGHANDIEESLSLFMQVKLSQACGYTEATKRMSDKYPADTTNPADATTGAILRSFELGWPEYQANHHQDIIEYMLQQTIAAFPLSLH
jgi:hypothetical protein